MSARSQLVTNTFGEHGNILASCLSAQVKSLTASAREEGKCKVE